jgi:hypothetical protein
MQWQWNRLEKWSPRIWPLTIGVGLLVLGVALYNLCLTLKADRPELVSTEARLSVSPGATSPEGVGFTWGNVGKRSALRGTVTLFTVSDDGNRHEKFSQSEIASVGGSGSTTLTPTFGYGTAYLPVDMHKFLGLFLACVKYDDETNNSYKQKFLFRLGNTTSSVTTLDELPSTHQACPK